MHTADPNHQALLDLYRQACEAPATPFRQWIFGWLQTHLRFDKGAIITSFRDQPAYLDAHFHGHEDPSAMLASWTPVSHLDVLSPRMLAHPGQAQRQDIDDAEIAGEHFLQLRAHLQRFGIIYSLCVAIPVSLDQAMTVFILTRSTTGDRFTDEEAVSLQLIAPHVAQALTISRSLVLLRNPNVGIDTLPVAFIDNQGRLIHTTTAFNRVFQAKSPAPTTTQLEAACLRALAEGSAWPLADGQHALHGIPDGDGWLLQIRPVSKLDSLSAREAQVAKLYASGSSRKEIAKLLGSAPSTVKNQLSQCFRKLGVTTRKELIALVRT